jgi:hypothetical protein
MKIEVQEVVDNAMRATFDGMFGWSVQQSGGRIPVALTMPVRSHVLLRDSMESTVDVVLQFDPRLLSLAGAKLYPEDMQGSTEMMNDMAAEISNIVAARIKAFLNGKGHALQMSIPEPAAFAEIPTADGVDISFQYDNGGTPKPLGVVVSVHLRDLN